MNYLHVYFQPHGIVRLLMEDSYLMARSQALCIIDANIQQAGREYEQRQQIELDNLEEAGLE